MSWSIVQNGEPRGITSNTVVVILLAGILATQILILLRMPSKFPTLGDFQRSKSNEESSKLGGNIPLIRVQGGSVDVSGRVEVENTPLEVKTGYQPIEVVVAR